MMHPEPSTHSPTTVSQTVATTIDHTATVALDTASSDGTPSTTAVASTSETPVDHTTLVAFDTAASDGTTSTTSEAAGVSAAWDAASYTAAVVSSTEAPMIKAGDWLSAESVMVKPFPNGTRCSDASHRSFCTPTSYKTWMTLDECLECCAADSDCKYVEFKSELGESGECMKMSTCSGSLSIPGDITVTFKKVNRGAFDSPQWMMRCPVPPTMTTSCMSEELYDEVVASIKQLVEGLNTTCEEDHCEQADFGGCVLRMVGHDFMDFDSSTGNGGADACTDMEDPDNAGLPECLYSGEFEGEVSLRDAYRLFCDRVSLADFLVIAAQAVMSLQAEDQSKELLSQGFKSQFHYGRTTSFEGCDFSEGILPNPEDSCVAVKRVFVDSLGLTWSEAAALMGVHTLGRAQIQNSGYQGWWSDPENSRRFNSNYFVSILAKGWCVERNVNGCSEEGLASGMCVKKNQWQRCDVDRNRLSPEMMLDTDMCLAFSDQEGGDGMLRASEDDCCAWVHTMARPDGKAIGGDFNMSGVIKANHNEFCSVKCGGSHPDVSKGEPFLCFKDTLRQGINERRACCTFRTQDVAVDCRNPGLGAEAGTGGPAAEAVRLFAEDEHVWVREFLGAWKKAVENGFEAPGGHLKALGQC